MGWKDTRKDMGAKHKHVNGLSGYSIDKVLEFTFGEKSKEFIWSTDVKGYIFYLRDNVYDNPQYQKQIEYFKQFWMVDIQPLRNWEPQ